MEAAAGRVGRPFRAARAVLILMPETRPVEAAAALVDGRQSGAARLHAATAVTENAGLWPLCIEYGMSVTWACLFALLAAYRVIDLVFFRIDLQSAPILLLGWAGLLIATTCSRRSC